MDIKDLHAELDQLEGNIPAMLNAILRRTLQNQAMLHAIIHNQALDANDTMPDLDVDTFTTETQEIADEFYERILKEVVNEIRAIR